MPRLDVLSLSREDLIVLMDFIWDLLERPDCGPMGELPLLLVPRLIMGEPCGLSPAGRFITVPPTSGLATMLLGDWTLGDEECSRGFVKDLFKPRARAPIDDEGGILESSLAVQSVPKLKFFPPSSLVCLFLCWDGSEVADSLDLFSLLLSWSFFFFLFSLTTYTRMIDWVSASAFWITDSVGVRLSGSPLITHQTGIGQWHTFFEVWVLVLPSSSLLLVIYCRRQWALWQQYLSLICSAISLVSALIAKDLLTIILRAAFWRSSFLASSFLDTFPFLSDMGTVWTKDPHGMPNL